MGGRGRGRGRGVSMSFNVEQLGFGRGEALPQAALAPPVAYPPLSTKPLPLVSDVQHDYMLVIKKEMTHFWRDSPCYVTAPVVRGCIERYSDRYQEAAAGDQTTDRHPDTSRLPAELKLASAPTRKRKRADKASGKQAKWLRGGKDVKDTLEKLEKREKMGDAEEKKEGDNEGAVESDEEAGEVDDVELDEGTDYINDYFDNGEEYLDADEDALEEGPIF